MMLRSIALTAALIIAGVSRAAAATANIAATSPLGRKLLEKARPYVVDDATDASDHLAEQQQQSQQHDDRSSQRRLDENYGDYSFVAAYSLKFQGCHHVQQWNNDADDQQDVRIKTKRLARFRLCPADQCSNDRSTGCNSKFGDYVVDMSTFIYTYLEALEEDSDDICREVASECGSACSDADCMETCYQGYDASYCYYYYNNNNNNNNNNGGNGNADFDVAEYAECQQLDIGDGRRRHLEDGNDYYNNYYNGPYYIGAYCADQGGEIRMGLFTDDTCTTFAQDGDSVFYNAMGFNLPFSEESLVSTRCLSCGYSNNNNNYNNGNDEADGYIDGYQSKDQCENIYGMSGKCETRMSIDYPNESACSYIEGIKIVRDDGVIRTSTTKKSKAAAVAIGLFLTLAVLLAGYVYYLRTKLGRAQINLAAASQPLT